MIEVSNLTKKYGDHIAVDHLSFRVEKGQIYGFLGPNGAGKSTTMNIITGYLAATEGTVTIDIDFVVEKSQVSSQLIRFGLFCFEVRERIDRYRIDDSDRKSVV